MWFAPKCNHPNKYICVLDYSIEWVKEAEKTQTKRRNFAQKWKWIRQISTTNNYDNTTTIYMTIIVIIRFVHLIRLLSLQCRSLTFNRLELYFFLSFHYFSCCSTASFPLPPPPASHSMIYYSEVEIKTKI